MNEFTTFLKIMGALYGMSIGGISLFIHYRYNIPMRVSLIVPWTILLIGLWCSFLVTRLNKK